MFLVSLHKKLVELLPQPARETFSACLIVLNNLCEVFGCSVIADVISTMSGLSKVFCY